MAPPPVVTSEMLQKVTAVIQRAGLDVDISAVKETVVGGVPVAEFATGDVVLRHSVAILRRLAQTRECGLMGTSFLEEGQVDSWLQWTSLEVEHHFALPGAPADVICDTLEKHLKSRTFLVGQRLTVADISLVMSLRTPVEKNFVELQKTYPATIRWLRTCTHHLGLAESAVAKPTAQVVKPAPAKTPAPTVKEAKVETPAKSAATEEVASSGGKKDEKKKAKEDAKRAKEEAKKQAEEDRKAAADAKFRGPDVTLDNFEEHAFGNLMIQSQRKTGRKWTSVKLLTPALKDQQVWVRARVQGTRKQGGKLCFLTLRMELATVQAVVFGQEIAGFSGALPDESVVDIFGKVVAPEVATSCSQSEVEINVEKIFCIGRSKPLPLLLADASRSEADLAKDPSLIRVGRDVRLDNRIIDLRTNSSQGIMRIQSGVCRLFRDFLTQRGFVEIHTPKMIATASEGGADVFKLNYFDGHAFLAQSPQLYKQMALMTDLPKVFEIGPVFRSENSMTHRHMTEFTGLDLEMTFKDHYSEVLDVLDGLFNHIFEGLSTQFAAEREAVRQQYPFEDLKWKYPCLKLKYPEAIKLLREKGPAVVEEKLKTAANDHEKKVFQAHLESVKVHDDEEDISTEDEKVLGAVIKQEFGEEFYIIDKFPKAVRPFYTMADPQDDRWTNSYDLFLRGEEITSGAQRIHEPQMLLDKAASMGVDLKPIQPYVDSFKYGAYPHAGAGIGLERVVMLFLNCSNIRMTSMFPRDPKRLTP
uniref:aspartate--tRNA ligase n=1 Tax=Noctiluca scintillans TaxID=2966 RepID=A0A7S0ZV83_NOCSC|mmetsp:Transcript_19619/g.52282  ORF Transcript_19619/g.52282 Transcript_19619/m.52282 type:complete len:757 (+) Transcript_19619:42-2312(+)